MAVNLHTTHYRFGINELAESTHGWHAAEDTNPAVGAIATDTTFLLRFTVQETGGTAAANVDNQFQCALNGGAFQNITTSSTICKAVNGILTEAGNCTKRLSGTGTFESSGAGQTEDGLSGGNANDIAASGNSETECALQLVGADLSPGDVITFRITSPDFTVTNDVVPTLTLKLAVTGGNVASGSQLFAAAVAYKVAAATVASGLSLFAPTVSQAGGAQAVTGGTVASGSTLGAPTVKYVVAAPNIASTTVNAPTVKYVAAGPTRASALTVNAPTVKYVVAGPTRAAAAVVNAPTVAYRVVAGTRASSVTLSPPTVAPGAVTVVGGTRSSAASLGPPTIQVGAQSVTGGHATSGLTVSAPSVAPGAVTVTGGGVSSSAALFAPTVTQVTAQSVISGTVASTAVLYGITLQIDRWREGTPSFGPAAAVGRFRSGRWGPY